MTFAAPIERDFSPDELRSATRRCPWCHGSGRNRHRDGGSFLCPDCDGTGQLMNDPEPNDHDQQ